MKGQHWKPTKLSLKYNYKHKNKIVLVLVLKNNYSRSKVPFPLKATKCNLPKLNSTMSEIQNTKN